MSFQPEFMTRFEEFKAERERVRTQEEWIAFRRKWFDTSKWPTKSPAQLAAESPLKSSSYELGGRRWGYTQWTTHLTPEARYEYFWTLHVIGDPLTFPHLRDQPERRPEDGWTQECHFCEISTSQIGEEVCPQCGRALVFVCYAD